MNKTQKIIAVLTFLLWAAVSLLWGYQRTFKSEALLYITYSITLIAMFIWPSWTKIIPAIMAGSMPLTVLAWWQYWGLNKYPEWIPPFRYMGMPGIIVLSFILPAVIFVLAVVLKKSQNMQTAG